MIKGMVDHFPNGTTGVVVVGNIRNGCFPTRHALEGMTLAYSDLVAIKTAIEENGKDRASRREYISDVAVTHRYLDGRISRQEVARK